MPKVKRLNKVLTIPEEALDRYLREGYDQIDENGQIIKRATGGRFVSISEYNRLVAELEKAKAEIQKLKAEKTKASKTSK